MSRILPLPDRVLSLSLLDPLREHEEVADLIVLLIEIAEREISGNKAGRKRLDAVAETLASRIDIPYVPEFVEVAVAKLLVQQTFTQLRKLGKL